MIIWRGFGILIALFFIVGLLIATVAAEGLWGSPLPRSMSQISDLAGMLLASVLAYALHVWLHNSQRYQVAVTTEAGDLASIPRKHDLFFVPVKYWPLVFAGLGVMFFFQS